MLGQLGGPRSVALYPTAWGEVSNTPFPSFKTYTGGGGRRVSFIASWPARIKDVGALRRQFMHVTDVMPTLLDLASVPRLETSRGRPARALDGMSCAQVLLADAPSPRREQYYECWSNRAYYRDGWLARSLQIRDQPIDMDNWTLHHLDVRLLGEPRRRRRASAQAEGAGRRLRCRRVEVPRLSARQPWAPGQVQRHAGLAPRARRSPAPVPARRAKRPSQRRRADGRRPLVPRPHPLSAARGRRGRALWSLGDIIGGMVMYVESGRPQLPLQRLRRASEFRAGGPARRRARSAAGVRGAGERAAGAAACWSTASNASPGPGFRRR